MSSGFPVNDFESDAPGHLGMIAHLPHLERLVVLIDLLQPAVLDRRLSSGGIMRVAQLMHDIAACAEVRLELIRTIVHLESIDESRLLGIEEAVKGLLARVAGIHAELISIVGSVSLAGTRTVPYLGPQSNRKH